MADISHTSEPVLRKGDIERVTGDIKRKAVFTLKCPRMPDMIVMIVGNEDGIYVPDVPTMGSKPSLCFDAAQACVKEKPSACSFYVNAVTTAAGL
jgi:hypothetical protein